MTILLSAHSRPLHTCRLMNSPSGHLIKSLSSSFATLVYSYLVYCTYKITFHSLTRYRPWFSHLLPTPPHGAPAQYTSINTTSSAELQLLQNLTFLLLSFLYHATLLIFELLPSAQWVNINLPPQPTNPGLLLITLLPLLLPQVMKNSTNLWIYLNLATPFALATLLQAMILEVFPKHLAVRYLQHPKYSLKSQKIFPTSASYLPSLDGKYGPYKEAPYVHPVILK